MRLKTLLNPLKKKGSLTSTQQRKTKPIIKKALKNTKQPMKPLRLQKKVM